jgi:hypothetical protein
MKAIALGMISTHVRLQSYSLRSRIQSSLTIIFIGLSWPMTHLIQIESEGNRNCNWGMLLLP